MLFRSRLRFVAESFVGVLAVSLVVIFQPELRQALVRIGQSRWLSRGDGRLNETVPAIDEAVEFLFNRTPANLARVAMAGRRSMKSEIPVAPLDAPAWIDVPSSYLVCGDDKAVNLDQQRMRAGWAKHSIEIDCDHSPFFSAPDATARFILDTHRAEVG